MTRPRGMLTRNDTATRINHWITALCFVLLAISGLSMFDPLLYWMSAFFGSGQWARGVHPWIGIALVISYTLLVAQLWRDNYWTKDDFRWLMAINKVLANEEEGVPEVARFNAGQKFVMWSMAILIPILLVTGLIIWQYYFSSWTSIPTQRAALLIHSLCAIAAILIWIIHVYAAIWVRGSMRAMTQGYVTPGWAWRHHRKWFRSLVATGSTGPRPNPVETTDRQTRAGE